MYAGYGAFLLRDLPFDAIEFVSYEQVSRAGCLGVKWLQMSLEWQVARANRHSWLAHWIKQCLAFDLVWPACSWIQVCKYDDDSRA